MSGKWTQTPCSSNKQDILLMALPLLRLYKPLQCCAMFCLCASSSPFCGRLVCFPSLASVLTCLLLSVKLCLMLVSSLSPHCLSFGPTHAFFHPIATFSNFTEVVDSDAHICICLCLIMHIPTGSPFTCYRFVCTS